ncbi:ABC transporter substrate-binding protein [Candidatus Atelocyanobacterium thalassae]|uniref:ABC transporter substrate-binding protein n=1 Tax=cyanobacterium endosymbiont of Braarudosphaera bigelowii TaxID=1285375 RepID=A0ABM7U472_9CHRO|nr:sugar ABC transporter substrate-binding protein [Candidatus Atelocyanobacterium thalassa]BDA39427.1 hypothetical protein CPARK_000026600 [cyanobacterium endosymbiont of Braarudosphaera bigelowii]
MRKFFNLNIVIFFGLCGLSMSWIAGCSYNSVPVTTEELEFWTMQLQPKFTSYVTKLIEEFEQEHENITIRWTDIPWEAMENKILTAVLSNTAPDVVNLNSNFAAKLANRNVWLDFNQHIFQKIKKNYLPNIQDSSSIGDSTFGLPWYLTTQITLYNKNLFKQADITNPPKTFDELISVAIKIKKKTGKYATFFTFVPGDSGEILESLVKMGVTLIDDQGQAGFNTPEGMKAFQYWVLLYKQGLLPPEVLTQGHRHALELYQSGEIALLSTGVESFSMIKKNAPTIAQVSVSAPQITGDTGKKNVAVMNLFIPNSTKKTEEAIKFAEFVTSTSNQLVFARQANVLPSTIDGIKTYIYEQKQLNYSTPLSDAITVSAMQLKNTETLIPIQENINQLQKIIYENLQYAMLEKKSVKQALSDAAETWNNFIAE